MKRLIFIFLTLCFVSIAFVGCNLLRDKDRYEIYTNKKFESLKNITKDKSEELFDLFDKPMPREVKNYLIFLYAYMPLGDLSDYDSKLFSDWVLLSMRARETFEWGKAIPEDLFKHYVLPYRVNNEYLDNSRGLFYEELKGRVCGMSMKEAALEVNHWCHEKVSYKGSDERTSSPLATMRNALGRCGEESTFTVAALRSVCIPARQVYVPRWAHSDDNHAWVEFWADGKWYYMGACEPSADANMGWFTLPASRSMLMTTKTYGKYQGNEEIIADYPSYSIINVLGHYASTKDIFVKVSDSAGRSVSNADVEFLIYNYAEFFPLAKIKTDMNGFAKLKTGYGDLLIWAYNNNEFAFKKIRVADVDTVALCLDGIKEEDKTFIYDFTPPAEGKSVVVDAKNNALNEKRLKQEDSIRARYEESFMKQNEAYELASNVGLDKDKVWLYIQKSRGNWVEISNYMRKTKDRNLSVLAQISEKDFHDISAEILLNHEENTVYDGNEYKEMGKEFFDQYVLNPRVANEMIVGYRKILKEDASRLFILKDGKAVEHWIKENITLDSISNYYNVPISPLGVYKMRSADLKSMRIFYVALCRSMGIAARLEPGTKYCQYFEQGQWHTVYFGGDKKEGTPANGYAYLKFSSSDSADNAPKYYQHFTIARFNNGIYRTLEYEWDLPVNNFPKEGIKLEEGKYMMVTGKRKADGTVLTLIKFFSLKAGETKTLPIEIRKESAKKSIIGTISDSNILKISGQHVPIGSMSKDKQSILIWLDPEKEPSKHILADISKTKERFEKEAIPLIFIIPEGKEIPQGYWLPKLSINAQDIEYSILKELSKKVKSELSGMFPIIMIINNKKEITYLSKGYKIGMGEELLEELKKQE